MKKIILLSVLFLITLSSFASERRDEKYDIIIENNKMKSYITETDMEGSGHFAKFKSRVFYSLPLGSKKYERHKKRIEAENSAIY